jgi:hypothetical protein
VVRNNRSSTIIWKLQRGALEQRIIGSRRLQKLGVTDVISWRNLGMQIERQVDRGMESTAEAGGESPSTIRF